MSEEEIICSSGADAEFSIAVTCFVVLMIFCLNVVFWVHCKDIEKAVKGIKVDRSSKTIKIIGGTTLTAYLSGAVLLLIHGIIRTNTDCKANTVRLPGILSIPHSLFPTANVISFKSSHARI